MKGKANRAVVFRASKECAPGEMEGFLREALEVFSALEDAYRSGTVSVLAERKPDPHADAAKLTGLVGRIVGKHLITHAELDQFL